MKNTLVSVFVGIAVGAVMGCLALVFFGEGLADSNGLLKGFALGAAIGGIASWVQKKFID